MAVSEVYKITHICQKLTTFYVHVVQCRSVCRVGGIRGIRGIHWCPVEPALKAWDGCTRLESFYTWALKIRRQQLSCHCILAPQNMGGTVAVN